MDGKRNETYVDHSSMLVSQLIVVQGYGRASDCIKIGNMGRHFVHGSREWRVEIEIAVHIKIQGWYQ